MDLTEISEKRKMSREKEQDIPTMPLLVPPSRAPPESLPFFSGKESASIQLNQQGSH
jgi:hypothetical protein